MIDNFVEITLVVLALVLGLPLCLFGYRLFRFTLFVVAFVCGGALVLVLAALFDPHLIDRLDLLALVYVLGGVACGVLAIMHIKTGVFITGFCGGVLLTSLLMAVGGVLLFPIMLLALVIGVICGVVALRKQKPAVVVTSSLLGAAMLGEGVFYLVDTTKVSSSDSFHNDSQYDDVFSSTGSMYWTLIAIVSTLFVVGMLIQFLVTGKGIHHGPTEEETAVDQHIAHYEDLPSPMANKAGTSERVSEA